MLVYRTAVDYKLENKKFKVKGEKRSFCDYCGRRLKWYENIPVISWVVQCGKTRCCHKRLPLSYPIVELLTGFLFLIFYLIFFNIEGLSFLFFIGLIIVVLLVFSAIFDFRYMILPDFSTIILIIVAFFLVILNEGNIIPYLLSALVASGFLMILNLITKGRGMGMGDVKLAVFMGLFLGWQKTILAFYVAFVVGAILGIILMILKRANKKSQIPFGPLMILGFFIAWWCGDLVLKFVNINLGL